MRILHLPIKKRWFDMIVSGEKLEEYREVKPYWSSRLVNKIVPYPCEHCPNGTGYDVKHKEFDIVRFKNGYGRNAPTHDAAFKGIHLGTGRPRWGAEKGVIYFVISLG